MAAYIATISKDNTVITPVMIQAIRAACCASLFWILFGKIDAPKIQAAGPKTRINMQRKHLTSMSIMQSIF